MRGQCRPPPSPRLSLSSRRCLSMRPSSRSRRRCSRRRSRAESERMDSSMRMKRTIIVIINRPTDEIDSPY